MGVYNPFAELPNSCDLCDSREKCDLRREYAGRSVGRHPDCPLVEVKTPHGRIGDFDSLKSSLISDYAYAAAKMVDDEPTIIEAEGKDYCK